MKEVSKVLKIEDSLRKIWLDLSKLDDQELKIELSIFQKRLADYKQSILLKEGAK